MGTISHDVVVSVVDEQQLSKLLANKDSSPLLSEIFDKYVIISETMVNTFSTVVFIADGSKEFWEDSNNGDFNRGVYTKTLSRLDIEYACLKMGELGYKCEFFGAIPEESKDAGLYDFYSEHLG